MNRKNRAGQRKGTLALIMVTAACCAALLSGCADGDAFAATPVKLHIDGTDVSVPYVAIINSRKISLDEYRYYFLNAKYALDNGDETYWDDDSDGSRLRELKSQALQALEETYAVESLADELNLCLTEEEQSQIDSDVKNQIAALGGLAEYGQALYENYLTDELYRYLWKINFYCEKLWAYYFTSEGPYFEPNTDGALTDDELDEQYRIKFKALIAEAVDNLSVELAPEYDLITVDSLT